MSSHTSSPQRTVPRSGRSSPAATRSALVFPAPEGPASAVQAPASTSIAKSSSNEPSRVAASSASIAERPAAGAELHARRIAALSAIITADRARAPVKSSLKRS